MKTIFSLIFCLLCLLHPVQSFAESVPVSLLAFCEGVGEKEITSLSGNEVFHMPASGIFACKNGIWKVMEDARKTGDSATFYFDSKGQLLGVCQELFAPEACAKYKGLCAEANQCAVH